MSAQGLIQFLSRARISDSGLILSPWLGCLQGATNRYVSLLSMFLSLSLPIPSTLFRKSMEEMSTGRKGGDAKRAGPAPRWNDWGSREMSQMQKSPLRSMEGVGGGVVVSIPSLAPQPRAREPSGGGHITSDTLLNVFHDLILFLSLLKYVNVFPANCLDICIC